MTEDHQPNTDNPIDVLNAIAQTIFDKKGCNILALDIREVSSLTDFFLIAEGSVDRHVRSICSALQEDMGKLGHGPLHVEGKEIGDWVVIDFGDILVHLFTPEQREKYALEHLWKEGSVVDLSIKVAEGDTHE